MKKKIFLFIVSMFSIASFIDARPRVSFGIGFGVGSPYYGYGGWPYYGYGPYYRYSPYSYYGRPYWGPSFGINLGPGYHDDDDDEPRYLDSEGKRHWLVINESQQIITVSPEGHKDKTIRPGQSSRVQHHHGFSLVITGNRGSEARLKTSKHTIKVSETPDGSLKVHTFK